MNRETTDKITAYARNTESESQGAFRNDTSITYVTDMR